MSVRCSAIDCLSLVLEIVSKYLGYSADYEKTSIEQLENIKANLTSLSSDGNPISNRSFDSCIPSSLIILNSDEMSSMRSINFLDRFSD